MDVFKAISDPTRRAIIDLVAKEPININAIADNFDMSRPAVSKHIKVLSDTGLVGAHQQGRDRFLYLQLNALKEVQLWLKKYEYFWNDRLDNLDDFLKN
ncbi:MAG: metalloregulator ArsR/SmtB family transcription factor [Maribacter sp.]|uniref:ArsR/SmtB family transcription factor n=1 Tax=Maribacter sp. TaxID=1897614 RepID=UPI0032969F37